MEEEKVSQSVNQLEDLSYRNINSHSKAYMFAEPPCNQTEVRHDTRLTYDVPRVYSRNEYLEKKSL